MADNSTTTIKAKFDSREKADLAVEHLVQEYGINRADVFVEAEDDNSSGAPSSSPGLSDAAEGSVNKPVMSGKILVSADIDRQHVDRARAAFRDAGASDIHAS